IIRPRPEVAKTQPFSMSTSCQKGCRLVGVCPKFHQEESPTIFVGCREPQRSAGTGVTGVLSGSNPCARTEPAAPKAVRRASAASPCRSFGAQDDGPSKLLDID